MAAHTDAQEAFFVIKKPILSSSVGRKTPLREMHARAHWYFLRDLTPELNTGVL